DAQRITLVVPGSARRELVEEPQPLLGVRQWDRHARRTARNGRWTRKHLLQQLSLLRRQPGYAILHVIRIVAQAGGPPDQPQSPLSRGGCASVSLAQLQDEVGPASRVHLIINL